MNIALIIAGGVGQRMGQDIPKQFINVDNIPVIVYTMAAFQKHPEIDAIEIVCVDGWHEVLYAYAKQFGISKLENVVSGGKNGQDSIRNGLYDIAKRHNDDNDLVLIHDAIRPLLSEEIISDNIRVCKEHGNAITVIPCNAAMLKTYDGIHSETQVPRDNLKETQTPQTFFLKDIIAAHKEALEKGIVASVASCTMYIELGRKLYMCKGSEKNIKLTTVEDVEIFKALLNAKKDMWLH
ncbi:MAG: IspD/TarI family cytidylyltransferase [Segatella copri]|jgi:2-C-methyl-D-erythritol 4-phosphate cytidylyltransferase|nr:IspD/TarI family cytidylyltransferase [Segatella copri]